MTHYLTASFICRSFIRGAGQALISYIAGLLSSSAVMYSYYRLKSVSTDTAKELSTAAITSHFFFFLKNETRAISFIGVRLPGCAMLYHMPDAQIFLRPLAWTNSVQTLATQVWRAVDILFPTVRKTGKRTVLLTWLYFPMPGADFGYNWQSSQTYYQI